MAAQFQIAAAALLVAAFIVTNHWPLPRYVLPRVALEVALVAACTTIAFLVDRPWSPALPLLGLLPAVAAARAYARATALGDQGDVLGLISTTRLADRLSWPTAATAESVVRHRHAVYLTGDNGLYNRWLVDRHGRRRISPVVTIEHDTRAGRVDIARQMATDLLQARARAADKAVVAVLLCPRHLPLVLDWWAGPASRGVRRRAPHPVENNILLWAGRLDEVEALLERVPDTDAAKAALRGLAKAAAGEAPDAAFSPLSQMGRAGERTASAWKPLAAGPQDLTAEQITTVDAVAARVAARRRPAAPRARRPVA